MFRPEPTNRFLTSFVFKGLPGFPFSVPSPLDIAFQQISGLNQTLGVTQFSEGGENARNQYFATKTQHGSLILTRGVMTVTPLALVFDRVMQGGQLIYADVVILLLNHLALPVCGWTISNALPVSWKTAELNANASSIAVNTMELKYQDIHRMGIQA
ncbi:phage tail protein [Burkholderia ubonensis]|uniref:phage tail protein n=1 Tax=Burkholderia ubonensis TaxID=101571 RepID=UPI000AA513AA|nr:phage tail protein [Burkholderia ubonensis]